MSDDTTRVPPHDLAAERALLGAALLNPAAIDTLAGVDPSAFYKPAHGHIAAAIVALAQRGDPVDPVTVAGALTDAGLLHAAGGPGLLVELLNGTGSTTAAPAYAEIINRHAHTRRIMHAASEILEGAYAGTHDPADLLDLARRRLDDLPTTTGSTLAWADLAAILDGGVAPTVDCDLLERTDGQALLYAGRIHFLWGEPSAGKGWVALTACRQVMDMGGTAVYLDLEDTDAGIVGRLLALGATPAQITGQFRLVRPTGPLGAAELADLEQQATAANPELVVIDGIAEALANDSLDENSNIDVTLWLRRVPRRLTAATGAAVVLIDHVAKSKEERGRWGRGAGAKLAALDGVAYTLEVRQPFSREVAGLVDLVVSKDRHGAVGPTGAVAAHFHIEPSAAGALVATRLEAPSPDEAEGKPTKAMRHVSEIVAAQPGLSTTQVVRNRHPFGTPALMRALDVLVAGGYIERVRKGSGWVHNHLRPYPDPTPGESDPRHLFDEGAPYIDPSEEF